MILFAVRIVLTGARDTLTKRAQALCTSGFTPFTDTGVHIPLLLIQDSGPPALSRCVEILNQGHVTHPGFSIRTGQQLGYSETSGRVWAKVQDPDKGLPSLHSELALLSARAGIPDELLLGPSSFDLILGQGHGAGVPQPETSSQGWVVPITTVHLLIEDPHLPDGFRQAEWEHLRPNKEQEHHLKSNRPPSHHRAATE